MSDLIERLQNINWRTVRAADFEVLVAEAAAELLAARKVVEACRNARRLVSQGVPITLTLSSAEVMAGETFTLVRLADWEAMKDAQHAYDAQQEGE